jgi:hypothetical protein
MRALLLPFLLTVITWSGGRCASAAEPVAARLLLERSEDTEAAFRAYGFDEVRVFTWRGGLLEGKVNFREGGAIRPVDLGAALQNTARKLVHDKESLDPKTISGVIVFAIKKPASDSPRERECHVSIAVRRNVVWDDGKGNKKEAMQRATSQIRGMVPADVESRAESSVGVEGVVYKGRESLTPKGGKKFLLYELTLSVEPSEVGKEEQGK